jgi:hypothetical protein
MDQAVYHLVIRARDGQEFDPGAGLLESRLGRIPGVVVEADGQFRFGEADEHGVMEIVASPERIDIRIPRPWVMGRGPQVFALVFMTAEWCRGEVWDPQIEDTLQKDVVLQGMVAVRQAQREREQQLASGTTSEVASGRTSAEENPPAEPEAPAMPKRPWWKK